MLIRLSALNDKMHRKLRSLGIPEEVAAYVSDESNRFPSATRKFVARALTKELQWRQENPVEGIENLTGPITFEQLEQQQHDDIIKVRDWLRFAKEENGTDLNMHKYPEWDDMIQAAEQWHDEIANQHYDKGHPALYKYDDPQHTDIVFPDGWRVVRVDAEDLENEGNIMGHCVGGYSDEVESGESIIYSLRDPMGEPHVTWEMKRDDVSKEEIERELERKVREAEEREWEYWEEERWPELAKELEDEEFAEEFGASRSELEMAIRKSRKGSQKRQLLEDKLKEYEQELESWLEHRKNREMENESQFMFDDMDWDGWRDEIREELEREAGYDCSQIQGKQDQPPLDRYRSYLREFFKQHREYGTQYVGSRLASVGDAIKRQVEAGDFAKRPLDGVDVREEDLEPFYDALIERVFSDPSSIEEEISRKKINPSILEVAIGKQLEKPNAENFVKKAVNIKPLRRFLFPPRGLREKGRLVDRAYFPSHLVHQEIAEGIKAPIENSVSKRIDEILGYLKALSAETITGEEWRPLVSGPLMDTFEQLKHDAYTLSAKLSPSEDRDLFEKLDSLRTVVQNIILVSDVRPDVPPERLAEGLIKLSKLYGGMRQWKVRTFAHVVNVAKMNPELLKDAVGLMGDQPDETISKMGELLNNLKLMEAAGDQRADFYYNHFPGHAIIPGTPGYGRAENTFLFDAENLDLGSDAIHRMHKLKNPFSEEVERRENTPEPQPTTQKSFDFEARTKASLVKLAHFIDEEGLHLISDKVQTLCL